jgi:hypothetical protein
MKGTLNDFMEKQIEEGINYINESLLLKWLRECAKAVKNNINKF